MKLTQQIVASFLLLATIAAVAAALYLIRVSQQPIRLPVVPSIRPAALLFDVTPVRVRTTVEWQKVFISVPHWDSLHDHTIWRRMQFEDWDVLPADTRKKRTAAITRSVRITRDRSRRVEGDDRERLG